MFNEGKNVWQLYIYGLHPHQMVQEPAMIRRTNTVGSKTMLHDGPYKGPWVIELDIRGLVQPMNL